jgi:heme-degrading monooxygenase HmoA
MISRHWIGTVRNEMVGEYISHLTNTVFPDLNRVEGIINAYYLKSVAEDGTKFLVVTEWETVNAIIAFAGPDYEKAVVDPYSKAMMLCYEKKVRHYTI